MNILPIGGAILLAFGLVLFAKRYGLGGMIIWFLLMCLGTIIITALVDVMANSDLLVRWLIINLIWWSIAFWLTKKMIEAIVYESLKP